MLGSHSTELTPFVNSIKVFVDEGPRLLGGPKTMSKLTIAVNKLQSTFAGPPGEQALQLRLVLDSMPSLSPDTGERGTAARQELRRRQQEEDGPAQKKAQQKTTGLSGRGN